MKQHFSRFDNRQPWLLLVTCLPVFLCGCRDSGNIPQTVAPPTEVIETAESPLEEAIPLTATVVRPVSFEQRRAAFLAEGPWESVLPLPDALRQTTESFVSYLLRGVGEEVEKRFGPEPPFAYPARYEAEPNGTRVLDLVPLYRIFKCFRDECGEFERIESIQWKKAFYGEYVEAVCCGEKGRRAIRLTFHPDDGKIDGCWMTQPEDEAPKLPAIYTQMDLSTGYGIPKLLQRMRSLFLEVEVVEHGRSRRLDCNFDIWQRADPAYNARIGGQPYLQDSDGTIWRRVNTFHLNLMKRDLNTCRVKELPPGIYRVAARIKGAPGSLVSMELHLDGSEQETKCIIPLEWADSVEISLRDSQTGELMTDTYLHMYLSGWGSRTWYPSSNESLGSYWGTQRFKMDALRLDDGSYRLGKVPAGDYVLVFNPPADCRTFRDPKLPQEIRLQIQPGVANRFVITSDTVREYANLNAHMYLDARDIAFATWRNPDENTTPATVALLGFCEIREANSVLCDLLRFDTPTDLRLSAVRALVRHEGVQERAVRSATQILAYVNASATPGEFAPPCVELLRRADGGHTRTSDLAAELDVPADIRQLVIDLGSKIPALGVRAARQLATRGPAAKPAVPFLIDALEDRRIEWPPDESLIDFQTVASAARDALRSLQEFDESGSIEAALSQETPGKTR